MLTQTPKQTLWAAVGVSPWKPLSRLRTVARSLGPLARAKTLTSAARPETKSLAGPDIWMGDSSSHLPKGPRNKRLTFWGHDLNCPQTTRLNSGTHSHNCPWQTRNDGQMAQKLSRKVTNNGQGPPHRISNRALKQVCGPPMPWMRKQETSQDLR